MTSTKKPAETILSKRQVHVVQSTWRDIRANVPQAGKIFYDQLFTIDPSLRVLFKGDIKTQAALLIGMIDVAVSKLDRLEEIKAEVRALGARHKKYHVKPEYYAILAEALMWTLEKGLDSQWNEETEAAWTAVYTLLANVMIDG